MEKENLSQEEIDNLENFEKQTREIEEMQILDLDKNCNVSFQYAKTYSNYVKDWERTKEKMVQQLESGNLPPDTSMEFHKKIIEIGDNIMEEKLEKVRNNFENKFGESIFNYLGKDGKTKDNNFFLILFIIIIVVLLLF